MLDEVINPADRTIAQSLGAPKTGNGLSPPGSRRMVGEQVRAPAMETINYGAQPEYERAARARSSDMAAAREALAAQRSVVGNAPGTAPVAQPVAPAAPGMLDRANAGLRTVLPAVNGESGVIGRMATGAMRVAGKVAPVLGVGAEGLDVARVANDPNATGLDVATQASEGMGKLGAAGVGAGAGAMAGMVAGPVGAGVGAMLGGAAGYFGGEKLIQAGRALVGADQASPAERVAASAAPVTFDQQYPVAGANGLSPPGQRVLVGPSAAKPGSTNAVARDIAMTQPAEVIGNPNQRVMESGVIKTVGPGGRVSYGDTGAAAGPVGSKGGGFSVIPTAPGGGYGGPSFNASQLTAAGNGPVGPSAGLSTALRAAADRGDTEALAAHYQRGGGTFNGSTGAQDQAAAYERAATYAPAGSKRQLALIGGADRANARQAANVAQTAARAKAATDALETQAKVGEIGARAGKEVAETGKTEHLMGLLRQIAQHNERTDPSGKVRDALMEQVLAAQGKEPGAKFQPIDIDTGTVNPVTGAPNVKKGAINARTGQVVEGGKSVNAAKVASQADVQQLMKEYKLSKDGAVAYFKSHGITVQEK